jgi:DNA repair protein RecN (Recombination protein N)
LAAKQQVVCITHLPQIACFAERHFAVSKEVLEGRTLARVRELDEAERLEEVARMLGGMTITDKARQHAREMIRGAEGC